MISFSQAYHFARLVVGGVVPTRSFGIVIARNECEVDRNGIHEQISCDDVDARYACDSSDSKNISTKKIILCSSRT